MFSLYFEIKSVKAFTLDIKGVFTSNGHLASIVQAAHPPLPKPDDPGDHGEAEDDALEQGEDADGVHHLLLDTDPETQSKSSRSGPSSLKS